MAYNPPELPRIDDPEQLVGDVVSRFGQLLGERTLRELVDLSGIYDTDAKKFGTLTRVDLDRSTAVTVARDTGLDSYYYQEVYDGEVRTHVLCMYEGYLLRHSYTVEHITAFGDGDDSLPHTVTDEAPAPFPRAQLHQLRDRLAGLAAPHFVDRAFAESLV